MSRWIIAAIAGIALCVGICSAQTVCTPIAMGTSPSNTGSGTGPSYNFELNGIWYTSGQFTVPSATVTFGDIHVTGYVNVFGSYHVGGSCMNGPWSYVTSYQSYVFDLSNNNKIVNNCCLQNVKYGGPISGAYTFDYYDYGAASGLGTITLIPGHRYMWQMNVSTYVYGLGRTPLYNGSIIFTVE